MKPVDFKYNKPSEWYPWIWYHEEQVQVSDLQLKAAADFYNLSYGRKKHEIAFARKYLLFSPEGQVAMSDAEYAPEKAKELGRINRRCELAVASKTFQGLMSKLPEFQKILDKVLSRERLSEAEMERVNQAISYRAYTQDDGVFIRCHDSQREFLKAFYQVVLYLNLYPSQVGRCEYPDCKKLFVPYASGLKQKFCSTNCRVKSHRRILSTKRLAL